MPTIPKLIIQTGKDRHLRPIEKAAVGTLRLLHPEPEWKYLFFGDNDINAFIAREFPEYRETFRSFPRVIQRIDFFRYLAIFRLGGFYFDLDVFLYEKINDLCAKSCVFPFEELTLSQFLRERHKLDWEIGNYAFGAAPGSPFLKAAIENCIRSQRDAKWNSAMLADIPRIFRADFEVLNSTGPGLLTRTLAENAEAARDVTVLFPTDVCDHEAWHQFGAYGVHAMNATWRSNGGLLMRRLRRLWENHRRQRQLRESQAKGATRTVSVLQLA